MQYLLVLDQANNFRLTPILTELRLVELHTFCDAPEGGAFECFVSKYLRLYMEKDIDMKKSNFFPAYPSPFCFLLLNL